MSEMAQSYHLLTLEPICALVMTKCAHLCQSSLTIQIIDFIKIENTYIIHLNDPRHLICPTLF